MPRAGDVTGMPGASALGQGVSGRYPLEGRHVCPFCGAINETMEGPCPQCTMTNTAETRKATKSRIGPWYVLQSRNPAAPGMKHETLLGFVRKGRVKARSIVRGPTTHQLWRFACQVKGLSREFGLCYSCGGSIERDAQLCPQCNRLQDPPADPDVFVEGQTGAAAESPAQALASTAMPSALSTEDISPEAPRSVLFKEIKVPPPLDFSSFNAPPPQIESPPVIPEPSVFEPRPVAPVHAAPVQPVAPAPAAPPQAAPPPPAVAPSKAPRKRKPNDDFLSPKDLAAAFQLDFDAQSDSFDRTGADGAGAPPWASESAAPRPARSSPRRRRKGRGGRVVLVLILLAVGGFGAYLAIDGAFRRRAFDWAEAKYMALTGADLYPDLVRSRPGSAGAAEPALGTAYPAAASVGRPAPEGPSATEVATPRTERTAPRPAPVQDVPVVRKPASGVPPAATKPARPKVEPDVAKAEAPRLTREEAQRQSRDLFNQALDAEEHGNYAEAKKLYEKIMSTLPRDVWYQGIEARLRVVKSELGEK